MLFTRRLSTCFDYEKFKQKFFNNQVFATLTEYYYTQYPNLSKVYIEYLIKRISALFIQNFIMADVIYKLNIYNAMTKLITKGLSVEDQEKFKYNHILPQLKAYKEATSEFIHQEFIKNTDAWGNLIGGEVDNIESYLPLLKEILEDRATVILSYVYNYLRQVLPETIADKKINIFPPPDFQAIEKFENQTVVSQDLSETKHVRFMDTMIEIAIEKQNQGKKIGTKRQRPKFQFEADPCPKRSELVV